MWQIQINAIVSMPKPKAPEKAPIAKPGVSAKKIYELFADNKPMTALDLQEICGMHRSTINNNLLILQNNGLLKVVREYCGRSYPRLYLKTGKKANEGSPK